MPDIEKTRRIGPFRLATELLAFVERQLDAVGKDLGPRVAGWARLIVVALTLGAVAFLFFSAARLARRGDESARSLLVQPTPTEAAPCNPVESIQP